MTLPDLPALWVATVAFSGAFGLIGVGVLYSLLHAVVFFLVPIAHLLMGCSVFMMGDTADQTQQLLGVLLVLNSVGAMLVGSCGCLKGQSVYSGAFAAACHLLSNMNGNVLASFHSDAAHAVGTLQLLTVSSAVLAVIHGSRGFSCCCCCRKKC